MPYPQVYWDAAAFHALFAEEPGRVEACRAIVEDAKQGITQIYTSCITIRNAFASEARKS